MIQYRCGFFSLLCVSSLCFPGFALEPLWVAPAKMVLEGSAMVADLDRDGTDEVVTAAYEHVIAIEGDGTELWRFDSRGRFQTCPAILERAGERPLIFAGDNTGLFTCLDGAGEIVWQAETGSIFCASPALADLNGDGKVEVVQGDKKGVLHAFDALSGTSLWTRQLEGESASAALADVDGNGTVEVFVSTGAGILYALDATGEPRWEKSLGGVTPDWATCAPILFKGGNAWRVGWGSGDGKVFCLDTAGEVLWAHATQGAVASTLSAGDLDEDGVAELFAVTQLGVLHRFDETGKVLWEIDTQARSLAPGAILDFDGDGGLDYILCAQNGSLLVFDSAGSLQTAHQFPNRTINVTPAFGNLVPGRAGVEFAVTGGEAGKVFGLGAGAENVRGHWLTYRGDQRLTGAWAGAEKRTPKLDSEAEPEIKGEAVMTTHSLDAETVLSGRPVEFQISREGDEGLLMAEARYVTPAGTLRGALGKVVGKTGVLQLPLVVDSEGEYLFQWSARDKSGVHLAHGAKRLALIPGKNEQALAARARVAVEAALAVEGEHAQGVRAALKKLRSDLEEHEGADASAAERILEIAQAAELALRTGKEVEVVAFPGTMWENRDVNWQVPDRLENPLRITRRAVTGEHEPVSVKLMNLTAEPQQLRLLGVDYDYRSNQKTGFSDDRVQLFFGEPVPTNQGTIAWDPFLPTSTGGEIPPLETREFWINLNFSGMEAGEYGIKFLFDSLEAPFSVDIDLEVLGFQMAGRDKMRLCGWANYNQHAVRDMLAHGNTVFIGNLPPATLHEGALSLDTAKLDDLLRDLKGHDIFLLLHGKPSVERAHHAAYYDAVFAHLAEWGVPEERVALYPYDEPGTNGWDTVHKYLEFAREALAARPSLQFYVNGGGDLEMLKALNEVATIWSPMFFWLHEDSAEMEFLRSTGKTIWSYDCNYMFARPIGWNTKTINVVAQYRLPAVIAANYNATGIGYWSYNIGPSMWDAKDPVEYPIVYSNEDGTITTSRRWEAVRESMEDARILIALREKLAAGGLPSEAEAKVRAALDYAEAVAFQTMEESRLGLARYVLDASNNDATVEKLRELLLDAVAAL